MDKFYDRSFSPEDLRHLVHAHSPQTMMDMMGTGVLDDGEMMGGQSLDDIVYQNATEQQRRRSLQQLYGTSRAPMDMDARRASMMEFGSGSGDLFQFDPPAHNSHAELSSRGGIAKRRHESRKTQRTASAGALEYQNLDQGFGAMTQSPFRDIDPTNAMDMHMSGTFMPQDLSITMDYNAGPGHAVGGNGAMMNIFTPTNFDPALTASPIYHSSSTAPSPLRDSGDKPQNGIDRGMAGKMSDVEMPDAMQSITNLPEFGKASTSPQMEAQDQNGPLLSTPLQFGAQGSLVGHAESMKNRYSSSGFDMLGVLMRVATRPDPQVRIGPVDMSCAFVVCDVTRHDVPIVYCSEVFERLTGYRKHEILGQNCRFLQAPDGKKKRGASAGNTVDDAVVSHIRRKVDQRQEVQVSLINYRKGGQPFTNILTMIPIAWDTAEIKYYVGFQVDLVELPASIECKNPDGSHFMNYQRGQLPRYVCNVPVNLTLKDLDTGQSISRDQVSQVLANLANGEPERSRGIWDKLLLENADDVVHVLSLKGLFLYLSPSSRRILEYDPKELVGTALSAVCHPSDIVPVTRELKDASTGAAVSVVFRIRRKNSGYTWFECHGSLHTEQGKGKKCMVLVGRERPIYALNRKVIDNAGGIGEGEMWTKMSTSGMFLYVSPSAKAVLDRHPDELVGTSAQALMRNESKVEFGRALEIARTGVETTFKHDIHHKRGQNVHALTTIYPGDATRGQKPTFFVAQTRFPKMPRSLPASKPVETCSSRSDQASVGSNTPSTNRSGGTQVMNQAATPQSSGSNRLDGIVARAGGSGLAIGTQHEAVASVDNVFEELKTTRSTSWQFELRQMERRNRLLAEELHGLNQSKKKRKRRRGLGQLQKDCANCHAKSTPEWRRGPSGERDLCNSCGLRWAKQNGRISPRTSHATNADRTSHRTTHQPNSPARSPTHSPTRSPTHPAHPSAPAPGPAASIRRAQAGGNAAARNHGMAQEQHAGTARGEASNPSGYGGGLPAGIVEGGERGEGDA